MKATHVAVVGYPPMLFTYIKYNKRLTDVGLYKIENPRAREFLENVNF